jgi:DHA3 family macrolide efflux protein-like MFS transporter
MIILGVSFMQKTKSTGIHTDWKKNVTLFLIGQALSTLGTMVVQYAITWHITLTTKSGSMMTLFIIAGFLPMFFISPLGGVWADRFNRKHIINIADGAIALISLLAAFSLMAGIDDIVVLLLCAVVRSFGQGVQTPASSAFVPQIVPKEHLTKINGIQGSIQSCINLIAPTASGALMTLAPLELIFFLDVVTAVIGISILLFFVKIPEQEKSKLNNDEKKGMTYFYDLKEGMCYIKKHAYVSRIIIRIIFLNIFLVPITLLTPLQIVRNFGDVVWMLSAIRITLFLGMMAGGILIGIWGGFKNRIYTMSFSCSLCGIFTVGLGLAPYFWLYLFIMTILGIALPFWNTTYIVMMQTTVEPLFLGRVRSIFNMAYSIMTPLGMLLFGPIADKVSIDTLLIVTGITITLLAISLVTSKTLREVGKVSA